MTAVNGSTPARLPRLSRRGLIGAGLATGGALALRPFASLASFPPPGQTAGGVVPAWTWLLASADEVRPAAPLNPAPAELAERDELAASPSGQQRAAIARWGEGPAILPWTDLALDLIVVHTPNPPRAARALALLHAAAHDALVAARDARAAYGVAAFPAEHAALAGAAATVLAELFPDEPANGLNALAAEAALSRLWAGAAVRSEVEAGLALGRAVGAKAIERARTDGSAALWDGVRPGGEGVWQPTPPGFVDPPVEPLAGAWQTWVLPDVVAARPPAPPTWGGPLWRAELAAVQEAVARRTPAQAAAAEFWAGYAGTVTPAGLWIEIARDLIRRDGLDSFAAARVLALTSVALADGFVCCWDAKYAYWSARPITADPNLDVLFATPPFPSYTSGHSTISAAAATVLGHLFPADESALRARADEARDSRLWAGIHYPIDNEMGATMGAAVGRLVAEIARTDGGA